MFKEFQEVILVLVTGFEVKKMVEKNSSKAYLKHSLLRFKPHGFWIALLFEKKKKKDITNTENEKKFENFNMQQNIIIIFSSTPHMNCFDRWLLTLNSQKP